MPVVRGNAAGTGFGDPASVSTFSRRFFTQALQQEFLLHPIGTMVYLMPPYVLNDEEIELLAAREVFGQVVNG